MRIALACIVALMAASSRAQDLPVQGIAFAQAGEGAWLCRHENPEDALSCAREQCAEQAPGQACVSTAWCYPARWSGTMVAWRGDYHATQVLCGAPTEAALKSALSVLCLGSDPAARCDVTTIIDPAGNERAVSGVSFGTPASAAATDAANGPGEPNDATAAPEQSEGAAPSPPASSPGGG